MKKFVRTMLPKSLWTQLRLLRLRYTLLSYKRRHIRHNYGGHELELELIDPMGADWYDHDWPELPEISFLKEHTLRSGARIFDIGAHQGVVALMLARIAGPRGFVLAVEASPDNYAAAERNRKLNGADNCTVLHAAASANSGSILFNRTLNGQVDDGTREWGEIEVNAVSIDDLSATYGSPDLLFVDVEGYECNVLAGAASTLARRPDCCVEVHVGTGLEKFGGSVERLLALFPSGYEFFVARENGKFLPLTPDSAELSNRFFLIGLGS